MTAPTFPETPAWMTSALCAQVDPDTWWPEKGGSSRQAIAVCQRCPALTDCLNYALDNTEVDGIWGATTPRERRALRRNAA